jgi:hypothetical protein
MNTLSTVLRYDMFFILAGLILIVGLRMVTGKINTYGLITDKTTRKISPGRLQMLMVTLLIATYYVVTVMQENKLPALSQEYLLALGGSHLFYLGGKSYSVLARKLELAAARIAGRKDQ